MTKLFITWMRRYKIYRSIHRQHSNQIYRILSRQYSERVSQILKKKSTGNLWNWPILNEYPTIS